jgi:dihydrofolate reductase
MPRTKAQAKHKKVPVILIAALGSNRGIGYQGDLLYHIKDDMKHFMDTTTGHTVVMGRKTWESIPEKFRPFNNRVNIVVTRDRSYDAPGATVVHRFYEALEAAPDERKIYVIGGGEIYKQALSYADSLDLTIIEDSKAADVFFPDYEKYFSLEGRSETYTDPETGLSYAFHSYVKK